MTCHREAWPSLGRDLRKTDIKLRPEWWNELFRLRERVRAFQVQGTAGKSMVSSRDREKAGKAREERESPRRAGSEG